MDLLVTVDAAAWGDSDGLNRELGKCVKKNVNYYQMKGELSGSHGAPNKGPQEIREDHFRNENHGDMNDAVRPQIKPVIQATLNAPAPTGLPVGSWSVWVPNRDDPKAWHGRMVFAKDNSMFWDEPSKNAGVKHPGKWTLEGTVLKFEFSDDKKQGFDPPRSWVVKDLKFISRGFIEPEGKRGFFELEKQD